MNIQYYTRPDYGFNVNDDYTTAFSTGVARFILQPNVRDNNTFNYFYRPFESIKCRMDNPDYIIKVKEVLHNTPFIVVATDKKHDESYGDRVVGYLHLKFITIPDENAKKSNVTLGSPNLNAGVDLGMIVDPEYQGRGIGSALMKGAIQEFLKMNKERDENFRIIWPDADGKVNRGLVDLRPMGIYNDPTIYLTVNKSNTPAINLYKKFNFEITKETETEYHMKRTFA